MRLSLDIYPLEAIRYAIGQFKDLADISLQVSGNIALCGFSRCAYDEEITGREFENYLIAYVNELGLSQCDKLGKHF